MLGKIILVAKFPFPVSVNEMYRMNRHGEKVLTREAREFKSTVEDYLTYWEKSEELRKEIFVDEMAILELRQNQEYRRKRRRINPIWLHFTVRGIFQKNIGDIDNIVKILIDAILKDTYDYDDRYVADVDLKKIVDNKAKSHVVVIIRECFIDWESENLFQSAMQEVTLYTRPGNIYSDPTAKDHITKENNPYDCITEVDLPWSKYQGPM